MATCAMHASMALGFMVDTMNVRDKDVAPVAERLLREALLVGHSMTACIQPGLLANACCL